MARIVLVLFSYVLISYAERIDDVEYYYLASSYCYALFAYIGIVLAKYQRSRLLCLYSSGNILAAIFNAMMISPEYYLYLEWIYWDAPLNYCLILNALDFMIAFTGIIGVYNFIMSLLGVNMRDNIFDLRIVGRSK